MNISNDIKRFYNKIQKTDTCWIWQGATYGNKRYGTMRFSGKNQGAHRISYMIHNSVELKDEFVLHKCDNGLCVNPEHLFLGDQFDNMRDMRDKCRGSNQKLSLMDVFMIREMSKDLNQYQLASIFGVGQGHISNILSGKKYRWE